MNHKLAAFAVLTVSFFLLTIVSPSIARAGDYTGEVSFIVGQKMLDDNDWGPLDSQTEYGVLVTWGKADWPVQVAIDLVFSSDDTTEMGLSVDGSTRELDIGVRKVWERGNARPFLGGGIAAINAEFELLGVTVDDDGIGAWVDGGVFWRLGERFSLGFEVRISRAEVTFFGEDGEAGGEHAGVILGWGW